MKLSTSCRSSTELSGTFRRYLVQLEKVEVLTVCSLLSGIPLTTRSGNFFRCTVAEGAINVMTTRLAQHCL